MKIYLVSNRGGLSAVFQDPIYELENLIAHACDATIIAPRTRELSKVLENVPGSSGYVARALVRRSIGKYEPERLPKKEGPELALAIGMAAWDLQVFEALGDYRKRFDLIAGYVFDAWGDYPSFFQNFNRVFISLPEELALWQHHLGIVPSVIPFAADALGQAMADDPRRVDLVSYGRLPTAFLSTFLESFARPESRHLFVRIEGRHSELHPAQPVEERLDLHYYASLQRLLRQAKASLCFDTLSPGMRKFPHSVVTLRWYEAFAAGCAAVGTRPTTSEADRLLCWPDAHVQLPPTPRMAVEFLRAFLDDEAELARIRLRNRYYALTLHDWRLRLRDMLDLVGVSRPVGLRRELALLEEHAQIARQRAMAAGALEHERAFAAAGRAAESPATRA
ncbi:MAG: glycosyltransferase [Myxococcales bacterium]